MTKHEKNERKIIDIPKLNLSPQTILQINATVIAGLFILLTIQLADSTQAELVQEVRKLEVEEGLLNKILEESDEENFNANISERLNEIKLERESVRAELTAVTKIPFVIYIKLNPLANLGIVIIFFVISSIIILIRAITKTMPENYHAKIPMKLSVAGFVAIGAHFFLSNISNRTFSYRSIPFSITHHNKSDILTRLEKFFIKNP